jgi:phosphoribosyl 1,2-cyclic phosphodiesterase
MQGFCPLASGSKGNAIFFGTKNTRILIDAGISAKTVAERLNEIGVALSDIDAILITHEHTDHIKGLSSLALKYKIPVFANSDTAKAIVEILGEAPRFKIFSTGETFEFGDIEVHPFSIQHDTLDPVAFTIRTGQIKAGFCTDLGFATTLVKNHLQHCDYLYIEANHQPSMVHACNRPPIYKQRVLSRQGHLSNEQCAELLEAVAHQNLKHIHLAHLSQECNSPELALDIILQKLRQLGYQIETSIAFQDSISRPVNF